MEIAGWRLDLVRNCLWWRGGTHLKVREEFYSLLALVQVNNVYGIIYTDSRTFDRFYRVWLEEINSSTEDNSRLRFKILDVCDKHYFLSELTDPELEEFLPPDIDRYMDDWLASVVSIINECLGKYDELYPDRPPEYLERYMINQDDSAMGVWCRCSNLPEEYGADNQIVNKEQARVARLKLIFLLHVKKVFGA